MTDLKLECLERRREISHLVTETMTDLKLECLERQREISHLVTESMTDLKLECLEGWREISHLVLFDRSLRGETPLPLPDHLVLASNNNFILHKLFLYKNICKFRIISFFVAIMFYKCCILSASEHIYK